MVGFGQAPARSGLVEQGGRIIENILIPAIGAVDFLRRPQAPPPPPPAPPKPLVSQVQATLVPLAVTGGLFLIGIIALNAFMRR